MGREDFRKELERYVRDMRFKVSVGFRVIYGYVGFGLGCGNGGVVVFWCFRFLGCVVFIFRRGDVRSKGGDSC